MCIQDQELLKVVYSYEKIIFLPSHTPFSSFPFFIVGEVENSSNKGEKILGDRFQIIWGVIVF